MTQNYVRFMILGEGRTGSNLLVQTLNSHPEIVCFREVFNWTHRRIDYQFRPYEHLRTADLEMRKERPLQFLRDRVFTDHGPGIQAVGFKLHYGHALGYEGLEETLARDMSLRVIHLRRHNMLRTLASFKIAQQTGIWERDEAPTLRQRANVVARLGLHRITAMLQDRGTVKIGIEECARFFIVHQLQAQRYDELFSGHAMLPLLYEDLVRDLDSSFGRIASFLGIRHMAPSTTLQRQSRRSLRDTIRNYDELKAAFAASPHAGFFDE